MKCYFSWIKYFCMNEIFERSSDMTFNKYIDSLIYSLNSAEINPSRNKHFIFLVTWASGEIDCDPITIKDLPQVNM